ncbi:MAG TPA: hypothetical protein VJ729_12080 [Nitrososphaeraceae archaeon]|nr:hypothetical protein [Nitrososphaeraceae archaeon]
MTILSNALIVLANAFRESGYNPPSKIEVDSQTFDKILAEAMELYNIDSKKAIVERKFSIKSIVKLAWNIINLDAFRIVINIMCISFMNMEEKEQAEHIDIQKEVLKPITKAKSKEDKELQEQEVESTGGGMGAGGG